jgi:EAL domain-containing protein (putative c-di-GMP-specific phosphodiesterase class I)
VSSVWPDHLPRRGSQPPGHRPRVLVAEDEPALLRTMARALRETGFEVATAGDGREAVQLLAAMDFDAVLSDIRMPDMDGIQLLRAVRERDLELPVILVTASPDVHTAQQAIEYGAFRYIMKPVQLEELERTMRKAVQLREVARLKSEALRLFGDGSNGEPTIAERCFERALGTLWMAYQPIVWGTSHLLFGHEALLRTHEPALPEPGVVLDTAERLGRQMELARKVRARASEPVKADPESGVLFVNLLPSDLMDDMLMSPDAPLTSIAHRVILEITERSSLEHVSNVRERVAVLRGLGFRIAIDDLGAGYAGLTSFAQLEPDIVKLDMSLVRNVHRTPTKRKLIGSMIALCKDMKILVVGEGVETAEEREVLVDLGCDLIQGFFLSRPGPAFPRFAWA